MHSVLNIRPTHGGGAFRPQRNAVAAPISESVGLFLNDVGRVTDAALEQFGVLEHRCVDPLESESRCNLRGVCSTYRQYFWSSGNMSSVPLGA